MKNHVCFKSITFCKDQQNSLYVNKCFSLIIVLIPFGFITFIYQILSQGQENLNVCLMMHVLRAGHFKRSHDQEIEFLAIINQVQLYKKCYMGNKPTSMLVREKFHTNNTQLFCLKSFDVYIYKGFALYITSKKSLKEV